MAGSLAVGRLVASYLLVGAEALNAGQPQHALAEQEQLMRGGGREQERRGGSEPVAERTASGALAGRSGLKEGRGCACE